MYFQLFVLQHQRRNRVQKAQMDQFLYPSGRCGPGSGSGKKLSLTGKENVVSLLVMLFASLGRITYCCFYFVFLDLHSP